MLIPTFTVFDTEYSLEIITMLEKEGFFPMYNGTVDRDGAMYLFKDFKKSRLYRLDGLIWELFDEYEYCMPLLAIRFEEDVSDTEWLDIMRWLTATKNNYPPNETIMEKPITVRKEIILAGTPRVIDGLKVTVISTPPDNIDLKEGYSFRKFHDEAQNTMYYEVFAPSSDIPFTVVVPEYSAKSDVWFFSDIYACNAWDSNRLTGRFDFTFLQELWKYLKLPGEFTMQVVKDRVDACYPGRCKGVMPTPEPIVYRRSLNKVINHKKDLKQPEFIKRPKI